MKRLLMPLCLAAVLAFSEPPATAQEGDLERLKRQALASERFRSWIESVNRYEGWEGDEANKANEGRVRIYGVCNLGDGIAVILPRRALTIEGEPEIRSVTLEFGQGPMTRWCPQGVDLPENAQLWIWSGESRNRFQFSMQMSEGDNCWG